MTDLISLLPLLGKPTADIPPLEAELIDPAAPDIFAQLFDLEALAAEGMTPDTQAIGPDTPIAKEPETKTEAPDPAANADQPDLTAAQPQTDVSAPTEKAPTSEAGKIAAGPVVPPVEKGASAGAPPPPPMVWHPQNAARPADKAGEARNKPTADLQITQTSNPSSAPPTTAHPASLATPYAQSPNQARSRSAAAVEPFVADPKADPFNLTAKDADLPPIWETRLAAGQTQSTPQHTPATAAFVGRQMAEALQKLPDRPVELALSPEELGRVKLSISAAENAITVNVLAERPETLDLMRRHIEQLAKEFETLGYQDIKFAFAEGQNDPHHAGQNHTGPAHANPDAPGETAQDMPITLTPATGLDLRL
jgi:flagellar hook-length control protein FliK